MPEAVVLCRVDELASGEARRFDVAGERIALVRTGDEFHALGIGAATRTTHCPTGGLGR